MFNQFEKLSDFSEKVEKAPQMPETLDRVLSTDDLKIKLYETFSIPLEENSFVGQNRRQESIESYPEKITLEDGTVVTIPDSPNSILHSTEIDSIPYKTDDHGTVYSENGELYSNHIYELNGNVYRTDQKGRIVDVEAHPTSTPENPRDNQAQRDAGGEDRRAHDQGGHIVGRDMGGDGGEGNLVAMDAKINQSDYKRMENDIKRTLEEGNDVSTHTEIFYSGDSRRPDIIKVTVTGEGKETIYTYDNNINGTLRARVREVGETDTTEVLQSVLDETGGEISSVKEEYGKDGSLTKAIVNITSTDAYGKPQRTKFVIDR